MDERTDDLNTYREPEDPIIIRPGPQDEPPAMGRAPNGTPVEEMTATPLGEDVVAAGPAQTWTSERPDEAIDENTDNPDLVRENIEQTRANMTDTIDAIQDKLNPQRLKEQAKDAVHDATIGRMENVVNDMQASARGLGDTIMETIRENPLPTALVGLGLGWLVVKGRKTAQDSETRYEPANTRYSAYRVPVQTYGNSSWRNDENFVNEPSARDKAGQMADNAQAKAGQMADNAQAKVGELTDTAQAKAGELADTVRGTAQQTGQRIQDQAYQARSTLRRTMRDNPLALGAVALALGAAVGLAIPESQQEHQMMGPTRDTLARKTQETARDTVEKVQHVAREASNTAQEEAGRQGLTSGDIGPEMSEQPNAASPAI